MFLMFETIKQFAELKDWDAAKKKAEEIAAAVGATGDRKLLEGFKATEIPALEFKPVDYMDILEEAAKIDKERQKALTDVLATPAAESIKKTGEATAEAMAGSHVRSLVWLSTGCLIVKPPTRLGLLVAYEAAVRPVHIRNVGSLASEPLDAFWSRIYRTVGLRKAPFTVESFVDGRRLRPYFNTHCFAVDPSRGVLEAWWEAFRTLVTDAEFQSDACGDQRHRVFVGVIVEFHEVRPTSQLIVRKLGRVHAHHPLSCRRPFGAFAVLRGFLSAGHTRQENSKQYAAKEKVRLIHVICLSTLPVNASAI